MTDVTRQELSAPPKQISYSLRAGLFRVVTDFSVATLVFYFASQTGAWQLYVMVGLEVLMGIASLTGLMLIRRGRPVIGAWFAVSPLMFIVLVANMLISGVGLLAASTIVLITLVTGTALLPERHVGRAVAASVIIGMAGLLIDLFWPFSRFPIPQGLFTLVQPFIVGMIIVIGFQAARQFGNYNLSTKLLLAFLAVTLLVVAAFTFATYQITRSQALTKAGETLQNTARLQALLIGNSLNQEVNGLYTAGTQFEELTAESNAAYSGDAASIQAELERLDQQWRAADQANNNNDPLVRERLNNHIASEFREYREIFPENVEVFLTDRYGALLGATNRTSDFYQADEAWWQAAYNGGQGATYIGAPEFDESSQTFAFIVAVPLYASENEDVVGVLRTTVDFQTLVHLLNVEQVGTAGEVDLFLADGRLFDDKGDDDPYSPEEMNTLLINTGPYANITFEGEPSLVGRAQVVTLEGDPAIDDLGWLVIVHQERAESLSPLAVQTRVIALLAVVIGGVVSAGAASIAQALSRPITQLTDTAEKVRAGDLSAQAVVTSSDEIGRLAETFNSMTAQLRQTLENLEERVADRTQALTTSNEVSQRLSTILDQRQLVIEVVEQVRSAFDYYHVHIYLFDEAREYLVMAGGTGDAGKALLARGHKLQKGQGLVGRTAETNEVVLVADVSQDPDWLPNALLPETKAEIAVPIAIGAHVLGVLDVQHDVINGLTQEDVSLLQSIASQVAIALQNARLYNQAQEAINRETLVNAITQQIQQATTVEDVLQIAAQELGQALGASHTTVHLANPAQLGNGRRVSETKK